MSTMSAAGVYGGRRVAVVARPANVAGSVRGALTRRTVIMRRRFAFALLLLCVVALGSTLASKAFAGDVPGGSRSVTVHQGESLSQIAEREMPRIANGEAVFRLQQANNLNSNHIQAGQRLVVPAGE